MREIKFRGKSIGGREWAYGGYFKNSEENGMVHYIFDGGNKGAVSILSETVGEYTGIKDRNGKEIYEGDVVCTSLLIPGEVKWGDDIACFEVVHSLGSRGLFGYIKEGPGVLVIGNVHENPDLLKCTTHS